MNIELLDGKAAVVQQGDNVWLLGCPVGIGAALKEAGVTPTAVLLTRVGAPGLSELAEKPLVVRATPLRIAGLEAKPIGRTHGWDYAIKSEDGTLLWTERGDVSARDVVGFSLALIGNKHRSESFGENVITRPWPETAQYIVSGGAWQTTTKPWTTMDDVPANMKKLDDAPLTLEQANWIANVASKAGKDGKENWAVGISAFKKAHTIKDGAWVKNASNAKEDSDDYQVMAEDVPVDVPEPETEEPEADELPMAEKEAKTRSEKEYTDTGPVRRLGDKLTGIIHSAFTQQADEFIQDGYLTQEERIALSGAIGDALGTFNEVADQDVLARPLDKPEMGMVAKELPPWLPSELEVPGVAFKEQPNGRVRWFAHTTNDTLDLQNEVIMPEAIDWSLAVATVMNDRGPLLFRHLPLRLGGCDKQVRVGPLLFETGLLDQVDKNPVVSAAIALVTKQPGAWMMSPGLRFKEGDLIDGRYRRCWIAERSLTHKPANLTTAFAVTKDKEMTVTDEMLAEAAEQLGLPFEQIKALAQKYLDTQKEFSDVDGLLKALKEGVATEYAPPAENTEPVPAPMPVTPAPAMPPPATQPDWAQIFQANTAAMNGLAAVVKELAAGKFVDAQVQTSLENYLQAAPQFGSQNKSVGDGDEAEVRVALEAAEKSADQRATQRVPPTMADFEAQFTSRTLNPQ